MYYYYIYITDTLSGAKQSRFFIGGMYHEGNYKWTDGSEFEFKNWNENQPDNSEGNKNCVEFNGGNHGGKWSVIKCTERYDLHYICEYNLSKIEKCIAFDYGGEYIIMILIKYT